MTTNEHEHTTDELEDGYVRFTCRLLVAMAERAGVEPIPTFERKRIDFDGAQQRTLTEWVPHFDMVAHRCLAVSRSLREQFEHIERAHWDAGVFVPSPIPLGIGNSDTATTFEQAMPYLPQILLQPLLALLYRSEQLSASPHDIRMSYRDARAEWAANQMPCKDTVPLLNFRCDSTTAIPLANGYLLAPLTPSEKSDLYAPLHIPHSVELSQFIAMGQATYCLVRAERRPKVSPASEDPFRAVIDEANDIARLVTTFRLLKGGDVGAPLLLKTADAMLPWSNSVTGRGVGTFPRLNFDHTFIFTAAEAPVLLQILQDLQRLDSDHNSRRFGLSPALERFERSYTKDRPEERLTDLVVALESALVGRNDQKSQTLTQRGAAALRGTWDTNEAQRFLRALYNVRSAIVHESKTLSELGVQVRNVPAGYAPDNFVSCAEDMARDILRHVVSQLAHGMSLAQIRTGLARSSTHTRRTP